MSFEWQGNPLTLDANWKGNKPEAVPHAIHGLIFASKADDVKETAEGDTRTVSGVIHNNNLSQKWFSKTDVSISVSLSGDAVIAAVEVRNVGAQRFGASGCTIHRADLLDVLAQSIPAQIVSLSARCEAVTASETGAAVRFTDGTQVKADVAVGADGIHSAVRASLFGPDAPRFTGRICYRAVIPVADLPAKAIEPYEGLWLGPHGTVVVYGVRRGELINVVAHHEIALHPRVLDRRVRPRRDPRPVPQVACVAAGTVHRR